VDVAEEVNGPADELVGEHHDAVAVGQLDQEAVLAEAEPFQRRQLHQRAAPAQQREPAQGRLQQGTQPGKHGVPSRVSGIAQSRAYSSPSRSRAAARAAPKRCRASGATARASSVHGAAIASRRAALRAALSPAGTITEGVSASTSRRPTQSEPSTGTPAAMASIAS